MADTIPKALIKEFKRKDVVLFIGSGISVNANLPDWSTLMKQLKEQLLDQNTDEYNFYEELESTKKAQFLYDKIGKICVINEINRLINKNISPSEIHKLFLTLPIKKIITTNWDCLVERIFEQELKINVQPIWKDNQLAMLNSGYVLIKMHGTIQDPSSVVFSEDDYYQFINTQTLLKEYISTIIATSTILFLGYSFNDFDFKYLYTYVRNRTESLHRNPYIFMPNCSSLQKDYLIKRGLKPIIYNHKNYRIATYNFIKDLSREVSITAFNNVDRLFIMNRENKAMLTNAKGLIIRNQSNIGPLGTPEKTLNPNLFGNKEATELEIKCSKTWKELLLKGARAKCIICLAANWILERYEPKDILERLLTLRENLSIYGDSIEIVDIGIPIITNIDIYGNEVYLESKKVGLLIKSYNHIFVHRNPNVINVAINNFDIIFEDIKTNNINNAQKILGRKKGILRKYINSRIESLLKVLR